MYFARSLYEVLDERSLMNIREAEPSFSVTSFHATELNRWNPVSSMWLNHHPAMPPDDLSYWCSHRWSRSARRKPFSSTRSSLIYLIVIDMEIEMMMCRQVNVVFMWKEIRLFNLSHKTSNGNIFDDEFKIVELFDGCSKSIDLCSSHC